MFSVFAATQAGYYDLLTTLCDKLANRESATEPVESPNPVDRRQNYFASRGMRVSLTESENESSMRAEIKLLRQKLGNYKKIVAPNVKASIIWTTRVKLMYREHRIIMFLKCAERF